MSGERESHEFTSGELVEDILTEWANHALVMVKAGGTATDYERGKIAGAEQMRHLHLAEPATDTLRVSEMPGHTSIVFEGIE